MMVPTLPQGHLPLGMSGIGGIASQILEMSMVHRHASNLVGVNGHDLRLGSVRVVGSLHADGSNPAAVGNR